MIKIRDKDLLLVKPSDLTPSSQAEAVQDHIDIIDTEAMIRSLSPHIIIYKWVVLRVLIRCGFECR